MTGASSPPAYSQANETTVERNGVGEPSDGGRVGGDVFRIGNSISCA
jgi:hypothetical protein